MSKRAQEVDQMFEMVGKFQKGEASFFDAPIAFFVYQIAQLDTSLVRGKKIATVSPDAATELKRAVCASAGTVFEYVRNLSMDPPGSSNYIGMLFGVHILEIDQREPLVMSALPE